MRTAGLIVSYPNTANAHSKSSHTTINPDRRGICPRAQFIQNPCKGNIGQVSSIFNGILSWATIVPDAKQDNIIFWDLIFCSKMMTVTVLCAATKGSVNPKFHISPTCPWTF